MAEKQQRRKNAVQIEGRPIRFEVIPTSKGELLKGSLMFGGGKDRDSSFIDFTLWQPAQDEVDLVERAVNDKLFVVLGGYVRQEKWEVTVNNEKVKRSKISLGLSNIQLSERQWKPNANSAENAPAQQPSRPARAQTAPNRNESGGDLPF